jgi:hypothetical protein
VHSGPPPVALVPLTGVRGSVSGDGGGNGDLRDSGVFLAGNIWSESRKATENKVLFNFGGHGAVGRKGKTLSLAFFLLEKFRVKCFYSI